MAGLAGEERREAERPGEDFPAAVAFDPRVRAVLVLRMAGYSEAQVAKLIARGHVPGEADPARRAA